MRIDDAGPRTWLLAALAGWAAALWLLALAGMGGRIEPLPDDPALAEPLPALAPPSAGRLGSPGEYSAIAQRPLTVADRRPAPFSLEPEREGEPATERFEYVLTGVLMTPGLRMAIVQPAGGGESVRLRVGEAPEAAPSWRLVALSPRAAVFQGPAGEQSLELRSYDGSADMRATALPGRPAGPPMATPAGPMEADAMPDEGGMDEPMAVDDADASAATPEAQMEAIRKRIQARREQLRREARQPPPAQQR